MDKIYQVFVSSTYVDLQDERKYVMDAVLRTNCIPVGMELFPADSDDAWSFLERIIADCDYYIIILAGKYGSLTKDNISFTQKEYQFAVSRGLPVYAFLHRDISQLPGAKLEEAADKRELLEQFRNELKNNHTCRMWDNAHQLATEVSLTLPQAVRAKPREGWIRSRNAMNADTLNELEMLRAQLKRLETSKDTAIAIDNLASGKDMYTLPFEVLIRAPLGSGSFPSHAMPIRTTWDDIFLLLAPRMFSPINDLTLRSLLLSAHSPRIRNQFGTDKVYDCRLAHEEVTKVMIQLCALRLVERVSQTDENNLAYWQLSESGQAKALQLLAIKK